MENPQSWGPVEKAIAASEKKHWQVSGRPLAKGIAHDLITRRIVAPARVAAVEAVIIEALQQHKDGIKRRICGGSSTALIAAKLREKGLLKVK